MSNRSSLDAGEATGAYFNPWLISIQQMTVEINANSNEWPDNINDYSRTYGDSSKIILNHFGEFNIQNMNDSLIVKYKLKKMKSAPDYGIYFIDKGIENPAEYKVETRLEENITIQFDHPDEGQMTFKKLNDFTFLIIHHFNRGRAKTKMIRK